MNKLTERAIADLERRKAIATGFLRGELGRLGPVRVRLANALTLVWLQAVFGSVEEAFAPLLGDEPSVDRLIHILAILDVSTDRRFRDYRRATRRIEQLRQRMLCMPVDELLRGLGFLVMAFEGMKRDPFSPNQD
ncbi:MAG: hypothetical protein ACP5QG_03485 [candidate division WOR-3 bacterium]